MTAFLVDYYIYKHLPSFIPFAASTACYLIPFLSIHIFHWSLTALAVTVVSLWVLNKTTLGSFSSSKAGFSWGLISVCELSYFLFVGQYYNIITNGVVILIGFVICYTLYSSIFSKIISIEPDQNR